MELGQGTFGQVVSCEHDPNACYKVFHDRMPETMFHQMALFMLLRDFAALSPEDDAFIQSHFILGEQAFRLDDEKCGFTMPRHLMDLHQYVSTVNVLEGPLLQCLFDNLCDAVAYLNRRDIYVCDLSPGNTLLGSDGRWRLCDFDLWRGPTKSKQPAYALSLRAPELLAKECHAPLRSAETWAIGMTIDFANRGQYAFLVSDDEEDVLTAIVGFFASQQIVPKYLQRYIPESSPVPFERTLDWDMYQSLLMLDPARRSVPSDKITIRWPCAPWRRQFTVSQRINDKLRSVYLLEITNESCLEGYNPAIALCAMSLLDLYLSRPWITPNATVQTALLLAAMFLGHIYTQSNGLSNNTITRWTAAYGPATRSDVFDQLDLLVGEANWQCPLGMRLWTTDITWDMVTDMLHMPDRVYARFS